MAGFVGKWKQRLFTPKVPVVRFSHGGQSIEFLGYITNRGNSLFDPWQEKAWEIHSPPVKIAINGKAEMGYAVDEAGTTVEIRRDIKIEEPPTLEEIFNGKTKPAAEKIKVYIDLFFEGILGRAAAADDINEAMNLNKSIKNTVIGLIIGIPIGYILTQAMQ